MALVKMIMPNDAPMKPLASTMSSIGALLFMSTSGRPSAGEHLVEQAVVGRRHDPGPEQRIDHRRAHARQEPDRAEEGAGALRQRGGEQRQQQPVADVEDGQRAERRRSASCIMTLDSRRSPPSMRSKFSVVKRVTLRLRPMSVKAMPTSTMTGQRGRTAAACTLAGPRNRSRSSEPALRSHGALPVIGRAARRRGASRAGAPESAQLSLSTTLRLSPSSLVISSSRKSIASSGVSRPVSTPCSALNRMPL